MENMNLPRHISIIMDGNGRWAKKRLLPRSKGHEAGVKNLEKIANAAFDRGVPFISIYAFSTENWNRPQEELDKLFELLARYFREKLPSFHEKGIRIRVMGDISRFDDTLRGVIENAIESTAALKPFTLNIGLNYGSRAEIVRAVKNIIAAGETDITEETISRYLYTSDIPDPDLLIRTGERRLSNFMLYQNAYTELYFTDTLWPAFTEKHLEKALDEYAARDRRFGAIK